MAEFLVDDWVGFVVTDTDEIVDAGFFALCEPPEDLPDHYREAQEGLRAYHGELVLSQDGAKET